MTFAKHAFTRRNGKPFEMELTIDVEAVARAIAESYCRNGKTQDYVRRLDGAIVAKILT